MSYPGRSVLRYHRFVAASLFRLSCVAEPVVDLPPERVDPGDQRIEFPGVDFVLKPGDLITQFAQVLNDVFRLVPVSLQRAVSRNGLHETTDGPARGPFGLVWVRWTKSYPRPAVCGA